MNQHSNLEPRIGKGMHREKKNDEEREKGKKEMEKRRMFILGWGPVSCEGGLSRLDFDLLV